MESVKIYVLISSVTRFTGGHVTQYRVPINTWLGCHLEFTPSSSLCWCAVLPSCCRAPPTCSPISTGSIPKNGLMAMAGTMGAPSSAGRGAMQIPPVSVETQMYHGCHMTNWTNQRTDTKSWKCVRCKQWKRNGGMEDWRTGGQL